METLPLVFHRKELGVAGPYGRQRLQTVQVLVMEMKSGECL